jgi:hypothetical protein
MNSHTLNIPVEYIVKAAKSVKKLAYLIAIIGAVTSFGTQVELLVSWHIEKPFAIGIASTVDILVICAAIALQVPGLPSRWRKEIGSIMTVGLVVSITANVIAGYDGGGVGGAAGHAWPVIAYMGAEFIANRLRTYVAMVLEAQAQQKAEFEARIAQQEEPTPVHATATVQKVQTQAIASKPTSAKSKILELASATPPLSPEEIADRVGTKPGWVKHVIKTSA